MWNTTGVPLWIVVLVAAMLLALSQVGSLQFWRQVEDAASPGTEHAGLTHDEAVTAAKARVDGYLVRHRRPSGHFSLVRSEPATGPVQSWCNRCEHWQVELARGDERYCVAVTEDFSTFSNGCARWQPRAERPPAALVARAAPPGMRASPRRGEIVLQRRIGVTADLYVLHVSTGRLRRLTRTALHESNPVWSPDRTRIAFVVNPGASELDVYTMRADGSDVTRVTRAPGPDTQPTWLPDGRLAYRSVRGGTDAIYLDNVPLLPRTSSAEWSPSGNAIAFSAAHGFGFDVWLTRADARARWNLTSTLHEDAYNPRWSPNGMWIAFATTRAVYVMRADGTGMRALVKEPHDLALSWSPDSKRLAWVGNSTRNFGIHVTNVDSRETARLTRDAGDHAPDWR